MTVGLGLMFDVDCFAVDQTIADDDKENTQIKPADADERPKATPGEQSRTKKSPSPVHILTLVAEAGGSARHLLNNIRQQNKRGMTRET